MSGNTVFRLDGARSPKSTSKTPRNAPPNTPKTTPLQGHAPCKRPGGPIKPSHPYKPGHPKSLNQRTPTAIIQQKHKWTTEEMLRSLSGLHSSFFFLVQCAVVGRKFWLPLGLKALLCAGRDNFATVFRHQHKIFYPDAKFTLDVDAWLNCDKHPRLKYGFRTF